MPVLADTGRLQLVTGLLLAGGLWITAVRGSSNQSGDDRRPSLRGVLEVGGVTGPLDDGGERGIGADGVDDSLGQRPTER